MRRQESGHPCFQPTNDEIPMHAEGWRGEHELDQSKLDK
eukprot:CAMPEP_0177417316 /NCGR_PEP_ID=MMETSP0368-20130122/68579_1 /TAXON_ID=447022 ORGANISM="Scrippsiella hangoei-like, Strain SHHI-4" /NCGR_SAMPLE_ID=MMETSP0368 /ASSEMBLY_ACC=CAM_ASM_000363 /LENGTH=38 /DNA_ID= /DNA_START= /DNA_END= /DNA_ORIENTATION=